MKELIEKLNNLKITQTKSEWEEDIPEDIWDEHFQHYQEIDSDLSVDTRRWYETSITVLDFPEGLMGVRYITNMFSEMQDYKDCYHTLQFCEMEEFTKISYKVKK